MTNNYFLEYKFIPNLLEQVKQERHPLQSLIDIKWMKEILIHNNIEIDWDDFSIDVYDEYYNKTTLEKGKYIAYTFPPINCVPEAKYGVIDTETMKYYTFESDSCEGFWAIGSQDINCHGLIEMVDKDMTLENFIKSLKRPPKTPPQIGHSRKGCLSVIVIIAVVWGVLCMYSCGADRNDGGVSEVCPNCKSDSIKEMVVYGLLTQEEMANPDSFQNVLKEQEKVYGGCVVGSKGPRYYCCNCGYSW